MSMPVRCPTMMNSQPMSEASQFPNNDDDPFSVDSSHFSGFSFAANSHLTSSTSGKSSILNGNALGPHWRRRSVAAKYAVGQTNGIRLGEQEMDAVSSGTVSVMMEESVVRQLNQRKLIDVLNPESRSVGSANRGHYAYCRYDAGLFACFEQFLKKNGDLAAVEASCSEPWLDSSSDERVRRAVRPD